MLLSLDTRRNSAVATTPSRFYVGDAAAWLVSRSPVRREAIMPSHCEMLELLVD